ncbi:UDP-N-acetylmuramate--L-alanine ligase, partial [Mammaliicoccus sciuri]
IQDLIQRIDGAKLIDEESVSILEQYSNSVILFMGAGDIQKIQRAYMEKVGVTSSF